MVLWNRACDAALANMAIVEVFLRPRATIPHESQ